MNDYIIKLHCPNPECVFAIFVNIVNPKHPKEEQRKIMQIFQEGKKPNWPCLRCGTALKISD